MKKILGIIGIAAVLASSMFAAEVKAKVKITGAIIDYTEADKYNWGDGTGIKDSVVFGTRAKFMTLDTHKQANSDSIFNMSVSTDVAGAGFKFYNGNDNSAIITDTAWNIWFKPFDNFKVTMGNYDIKLNCEQIYWWHTNTGLGGDGYVFEYTMGDFTFDFIMNTTWNGSWIYAPYTMADYANNKVWSLMGVNRMSETSIKGAYKSPVGTISASVTYKGTGTVKLMYDTVEATAFTDSFKVAAGWNVGNLFGDNFTGFVNAWTTLDTVNVIRGWKNIDGYADKQISDTALAMKVGVELYAQMTMDAFKFQVFVPVVVNMMPVTDFTINPAQDSAIPLYDILPNQFANSSNCNEVSVKATYSMSNGVSPYVLVAVAPFRGATPEFNYAGVTFINSYPTPLINCKPGVTGKFGICSYEVAVDSTITLGGDPTVQAFTFSVPVTLTVEF